MCYPEQTLLERKFVKIVIEISNPVSVSNFYLRLGFNTSNVMYFSPSNSIYIRPASHDYLYLVCLVVTGHIFTFALHFKSPESCSCLPLFLL